jgi:hypothetical protein
VLADARPHIACWDFNLSRQLVARADGTYARNGAAWRVALQIDGPHLRAIDGLHCYGPHIWV